MTVVSVSEQFQPSRYLIVSNRSDPESITTTRVIVSDLRTNTINLVTIDKGPEGISGPQGPVGPPGQDGLIFDILSIASGGTNNSTFNSGYLLEYNGSQISSTAYTVQDIINLGATNANAITGIVAGTGLQKINGPNNTVLLDVQIGNGLTVSGQQIIVDDSIVRLSDLDMSKLRGVLPISKGGTNNSSYASNKLIYYDGTKLSSFPINTGTIVISGSSINIVAGSGLVGGGLTSIPNGTVVLSIPDSADILVEENSISLTNTGTPGTYSKVITDNKGRVVSGTSLSNSDILSILGYTPWHPGNDGSGSGLDADLLDGQQGSFYRDSANLSGVLNTNILPDIHADSKIGTKFRINTKGLVEESFLANTADIISSLGYTPLNANEDAVKQGSLDIAGSLSTTAGDVSFYDNLPLFGTNRPNILPSEPRGFTFNYGGIVTNKTGILAYYPTENQLKLITNIFASGSNVDGNEGNQDDMNGGNADSIFIIENLQGNALTILFREVADQLYLDVNNTQTILGLKRFLGQIEVMKQIKILTDGNPATSPPFVLYGNQLKVEDLNADLLDDKHGSYYSNAVNMTGAFDYTKVSFDHIVGQNNYIPKFTDTTNPAKRITSSNILQRNDGNIEISDARNLVIGEGDNIIDGSTINTLIIGENNFAKSENSALIGSNNVVEGFNSLAVGQSTVASGDNSIALNLGSITKADNSVAMGSYGLTQLENQLAFGAFRTVDGSKILEHGQYSTVAMYLRGTETNGTWSSLSPVISLPQDKTIAYNIEVLINKGLSSGVAHYTFTSGIINNATYRNLFNITEILNSTTVPNTGTKAEIFNNSQIRRHYHFWNYNSSPDIVRRVSQYVNVFEPPVINTSLNIRNAQSQYFYVDPEKVYTTGIFEKTFDGQLILDIDKPRYSAIFSQTLNDPNIKIRSKNHGVVSNAMVDIRTISGSKYFFPNQRYKALAIQDQNTFFIESPSWIGTKITENNLAKIKINNRDNDDRLFRFNITANLTNNTLSIPSLTNEYNYSIGQLVKPDTAIRIIHSGVNGVFAYNRLVREILGNQIIINHPIFTTDQSPGLINGSVNVIINDYSYDIFKMCDRVYVNTETFDISGGKTRTSGMFLPDQSVNIVNDGGQGSLAVPSGSTLLSPQNSGIFSDLDIYGQPSFSVLLSSSLNNIVDGSQVTIRPMFSNNSGSITLYHKDTFNCNYSSTYSELNKHSGCYIRWKDSETDKHKISIFDTDNRPVVFISNPPSYVFGSGYLSENNSSFYIKQEYNRHYLYSKEKLDYEESNVVPVKIKAVPYNSSITDSFEKVLYVYLENEKENPYVLNPIPNTGIIVDNLFSYTVPSNTFDDSDNNIIRYEAEIRGGHPLPRWLSFDSSSLSFSGIPDICDIGLYSIDVLAIDDTDLSINDNFIIEVEDNPAISLEGFANNVGESLRIQNIYLSNNTLKENSPPDTLIGELKQVGGYDPYVTFLTAENAFSGTITNNSDLIRSCKPNILSFIPAIISGSPEYLSIGSRINFKDLSNSTLATNLKVKNVYKPTVFSGTPLFSNQIILDDVYKDYKSSILFNNQKLPTFNINESFGLGLRVKNFNDYSITLTNYLIQELDLIDSTLILTENSEAIVHDIPDVLITYNIEDEPSTYDLCEEDGSSNLKYSDYHGYDNVIWSNKNSYSFFMIDNDTDYLLDDENNKLIGTNISNLETIDKKPDYTLVNLKNENNYKLLNDNYLSIQGDVIDDIWYSDQASKIYRSFHPGIPQQASNIEGSSNLLSSLNFASGVDTLLQSNIDYYQEDENLEKYDYWYFDRPINNAVLYTKNLGSEDYCHLLTQTRNYSGVYYPTTPFEYGLISTEDGHGLISDTKTDHGSRIEVSTRYEILESIDVFNNNGNLFTELFLDNILCENTDKIVHDYAISSRSGSAYILFPGHVQRAKFKYPKEKSYSSSRISAAGATLNGYYDDQPSLVPSPLKLTEPNFYYSWGKLISYKLYTNEYLIRTDSIYNGLSSSGSVVYLGDIPDSGSYFPEFLQNQTFTRLSGNCPEPFQSGGIAGFGIIENYNTLGEYVTGLVSFYSNFTSNNITITSPIHINQDIRNTDYVRLYNPTTNIVNPQLPRVGDYLAVKNLSSNSFTVENFFLYPSTSNVTHTGSITVNLDRNHQQRIKSSDIINRAPIYFDSVYSSNQNRLPKNNLFDITNISGNKIYTVDSVNYILKNSPYPDYFNNSISGIYTTNGVYFLGSLFHNNSIVYDLRPTLENFNQIHPLVTFEFDKAKQKLSINTPSGTVKVFDNIQLSDFKPLYPFMPWDYSKPYNTGFTVYENSISARILDDTEDKDFVLLERSTASLQPENSERLSFSTDIFAKSVSGTCTLNTKIANRLQKGYLINYTNNIHNQSGHQVDTIQDGYSFSGVIPKNHNILSSNQILNDHRIGYSSVVSTGSATLISGIRTLSFVNSNDIGYAEFYKINTSGFSPDDTMINSIDGNGSSHLPYKLFVDVSGSGSNKNTRFVEFLYLGHNSNTINFSGIISTSGSNNIKISRISLSDQLQIERLLKLGYSSGVQPILQTGTNTTEEEFVFSIPSVNRFDLIQIRIDHSLNNFTNYHHLYSYTTNPAVPLPVKLIHPNPINTDKPYYPSYLANTGNLFHILPCIHTTVKYCDLAVSQRRNNDLFYNGNIIKLEAFDSVKSFLNYNDQIKLLSINNSVVKDGAYIQKIDSSNNKISLTGITIKGPIATPPSTYTYPSLELLDSSTRYTSTFGVGINTRTPISGVIEFVGYNSGSFELLTDNNIFVQSHGDTSARWPQDATGKLVGAPITGIYSIAPDNTSFCSSGTLCVIVSGYRNRRLDNLSFNKKYYFDFSDDFPAINNTYSLKDKISPNSISISVPYDPTYFGRSGIVYIIDSDYNIKSNLNPNINNNFLSNNALLTNSQGGNTLSSLVKKQIHYFDNSSKKWTHMYHMIDTLPAYSSYPIYFKAGSSSLSSKLVHYPESVINIRNVSKLTDPITSTFETLSNNALSIFNDDSSVILKIVTSGGSPILEDRLKSMPKIFISGIGEYRTITNSSLYDYRPAISGWEVGMEIIPFKGTGIFPVTISAKDETGSSDYSFTLQIKDRPRATVSYPTGYASLTSNNWKLYFDVKGIDLVNNNPNNIGLFVSGSPNDLNYTFVRHSSSELEVIGYPAGGGFATGLWNPVIKIADSLTGKIAASGSGTIQILESFNDRPAYVPIINNFNSERYVNLATLDKLSYTIPVLEIDQDHSSITTSLNGGIYFGSVRTNATYDADMNRFRIEYTPTNTGDNSYINESIYASNRMFNYSVSQPVYIAGSKTWNNYSSSNYLQNITFYRPIYIDTSFINTIPSFKINEPWSIQFIVDEGITKYRSTIPPRVTLFNTPGMGRIAYQYLSYNLSYRYNQIDNNWIVTAVGKPDIYGRFAPSTGLYTIDIFADDAATSFVRDAVTIRYVGLNEINHIAPNIYTSPNNEFFVQADVTQEYNEGTPPTITFDGENTLNMNYSTMHKKYDPALKIWEISGTGNKMTEKWDSRLVINSSSSPSLTLQVKGIATDKITAVAKINLLELQNNNRDIIDSLPIKITGIMNFTAESGIVVQQGNAPWSLNFKTIRGLESPQHPPTIILENTPTFCTGYDPRLDPDYAIEAVDPNLQNPCFTNLGFDAGDKSWNFAFVGYPSCTLLGPIDFSITAIDTDLTLSSPYIEPSDKADAFFTYTPIDTPHPKPQVIEFEDETGPPNNAILKPFCDELYYKTLKFGPRVREACPIPTGLTGIVFSGSLPSGLSYSFTYPSSSETNRFNAPIYDNLSSGTVIIQGYPLAFAQNGDAYTEQFGIFVTDARNQTGSIVMSFAQTVELNDPNIGMRVYFESDKPTFTPQIGLALIPHQPSFAYRPQPAPFELACNSVLPNNKCPSQIIPYSGGPDPDNKLILRPSFLKEPSDLKINSEIYVRINNDNSNINNGTYITKRDAVNNLLYINTKEDFSPRTGLLDIVISNYIVLELNDFKTFFKGDIQSNHGCILGNGLVDINRTPGNQDLSYGIRGHLSPSLSGDVPVGGYFSENDNKLNLLNIAPIYSNLNNYGQVPYTNCWETGYLRISGIILPKIFVEITDPPPAFSDNFSVNGSTFALNTRLSFGNSELERSNPANWRNGSANYVLNNLLGPTTVLAGSVNVATSNQQSIPINASTLATSANGIGTVFGITINAPGDIFPTYNYRAKPKAQPANYFWIHKATTTLFDIPTQNSLPPVVPCLPTSINIISGVLIDYNSSSPLDYGINGLAYGGYVPHSICFNNQCPAGYTNSPYLLTAGGTQWSARNYLPKISGIILQQTTNREFFSLNGSYNHSKVLNITNTQSFSTGNLLKFDISNNNPAYNIETFITGLLSTNFDINNNLVFSKDYGPNDLNLNIRATLLNQIVSIDNVSHTISIRHNNLNNILQATDNISINSSSGSSTLNAVSYPGSLTITQINSTGLIAQAIGPDPTGIYSNFNVDDHLVINKIIEDNIKIMPNNISSNSEGVYNFIISGRPNILYGKYLYRIMTQENSSMPIFTTDIEPKSFERDVPMFVSKPLEVVNTTINWSGNSWVVQITVSGGTLPGLSETIDVKIDLDGTDVYNYCGFNRYPVGSISDSYDTVSGNTTLTISSNNRVNWQTQTAFHLRLQDSTGYIIVPISKP